MNIQTKRCVIRDFEAADIPLFMEYRNDMQWMQHQGYKGKTKDEYEHDLLDNSNLMQGKQFAIVNSAIKKLIGDIYLKKESVAYWLGYTIHLAFARQGYAAEAVTAVIGWVKEQGGTKIKAGVLPENTVSIKLLKKLGFSYIEQEDGELIYAHN